MLMTNENLVLGTTQKICTIYNFELRQRPTGKKLALNTLSDDGHTYTVNEVWVRGYRGGRVTKGLWVDTDKAGRIRYDSLLGKFLRSHNVYQIKDLVGKKVCLEAKPNGFMCIVTDIVM